MQPSANDFGFAYLLTAIEHSVRRAERALAERDWPTFAEELAAQRRGFHAVRNALIDAERAQYPTEDVRQRIRLIIRVRGEQLTRLQAYRDECGRRLELFQKSAPMRRAATAEATRSSRLGYLDVVR